METDKPATSEKQGEAGVQVEPIVERSRYRVRKPHHIN
jgi:hypothetical protein